jgi:ribosome-associated protein
MTKKEIKIDSEFIKLGSLLKYSGAVQSGAEAKALILDGKVLHNGIVEMRRGRKIRPGDVVEVGGETISIV